MQSGQRWVLSWHGAEGGTKRAPRVACRTALRLLCSHLNIPNSPAALGPHSAWVASMLALHCAICFLGPLVSRRSPLPPAPSPLTLPLQVYKDANHKPEMALAITEFEALCSFCPHEELLSALDTVPELAECCGAAHVAALRASQPGSPARCAALAAAFHEVMACPAGLARAYVERMCARLQREAAEGRELTPRELLALRLELQYPGDVGVLAAWFLNYLRLQPGQAVALPANEPHAYISGEIMECMATSGEGGWVAWKGMHLQAARGLCGAGWVLCLV